MKTLLIIYALVFCSLTCIAQDLILKKNGDELYGKVKEVTISKILYIDTLVTDTIVKEVKISEVFMIKYQNGIKEVFKDVEKTNIIIINSDNSKQPEKLLAKNLGSGDFMIGNKKCGYGYFRKTLFSIKDDEVDLLLKKAKVNSVLGNTMAYSSIFTGYMGLLLIGYGVSDYNENLVMSGVVFTSVFFASHVGNILLKIKKKKNIADAISIYNNKIESLSSK